jgi:hypothetical protein
MAIQKVQQFPPEQRNQVIQFIEFLDSKSSQTQTIEPQPQASDDSEPARSSCLNFPIEQVYRSLNLTPEPESTDLNQLI